MNNLSTIAHYAGYFIIAFLVFFSALNIYVYFTDSLIQAGIAEGAIPAEYLEDKKFKPMPKSMLWPNVMIGIVMIPLTALKLLKVVDTVDFVICGYFTYIFSLWSIWSANNRREAERERIKSEVKKVSKKNIEELRKRGISDKAISDFQMKDEEFYKELNNSERIVKEQSTFWVLASLLLLV